VLDECIEVMPHLISCDVVRIGAIYSGCIKNSNLGFKKEELTVTNATLKSKWGIIIMMAALGFTTNAVAHDQIGALGEDGSATDYYLVTCSTDAGGVTGQLETFIYDPTTTQGGGKISVVSQFGNAATTASDPVRTDTNPGPPAYLPGTDGTYNLFVHKLKAGPKNYLLSYQCLTSEGVHTGTALITIQDQ
jgi:hypothetical protein